MDYLAVCGAVIAFAAILVGNSLEGGQLAALLNLPAFIIVVGGTLGAIVLQTPWDRLRRAAVLVSWVVKPPAPDSDRVQRFSQWSKVVRREGILGLENIANATGDPFLKRGLDLVIDGVEIPVVRRLLETDSQARAESDLAAAQVFRSMGGYAPTIGILGAVIGLIQVMGNLADPDELGSGIATAFVATIYGVGFANLLFLPIADRLRNLIAEQAIEDEVFIEGCIAIAEGDHPRNVERRLNSMLVRN